MNWSSVEHAAAERMRSSWLRQQVLQPPARAPVLDEGLPSAAHGNVRSQREIVLEPAMRRVVEQYGRERRDEPEPDDENYCESDHGSHRCPEFSMNTFSCKRETGMLIARARRALSRAPTFRELCPDHWSL
jgi:hypothetical protein